VSRVAAIGEHEAIDAYGLAGVELHPAAGADSALAAWTGLAPGVGLLLLTPASAAALADELAQAPELLPVVIPE
jgi:hypothetical protein